MNAQISAATTRTTMDQSRISADMMEALGRFVVAWSDLEAELGIAFAEIIGGPLQRALLIYNSVGSFNGRRDLIKASIAPSGFHRVPKELTELLTDVEQASAFRNDIIHGEWMRAVGDTATLSVWKPRSSQRAFHFDVSVNELRNRPNDISKLIERASIIGASIGAAPHDRTSPTLYETKG